MAIEKEIKNLLFLNRPAQSGFDYSDWPVIVPIQNGTDIEIKLMHWEYIPESIHDADELKAARKNFTWLNAKGENILINEKGRESMYREGALHGRMLALSTGFFEWRHIVSRASNLLSYSINSIPAFVGRLPNKQFLQPNTFFITSASLRLCVKQNMNKVISYLRPFVSICG